MHFSSTITSLSACAFIMAKPPSSHPIETTTVAHLEPRAPVICGGVHWDKQPKSDDIIGDDNCRSTMPFDHFKLDEYCYCSFWAGRECTGDNSEVVHGPREKIAHTKVLRGWQSYQCALETRGPMLPEPGNPTPGHVSSTGTHELYCTSVVLFSLAFVVARYL